MLIKVITVVATAFFFFAEVALAKEGVAEETVVRGFYCYAKSRDNGAMVLRQGKTLEDAKNKARADCNTEHGRCEITQCYEDNPYKYSCLAGKLQGINRVGGFKTSSNDVNAARRVADMNCLRVYPSCASICYINFAPPRGFDETTY